jgi:voltage-gated potassium channel
MTLRRRVYEILDKGMAGSGIADVIHGALIALILLNVAAAILESVPSIEADHARAFFWLEVLSVAVFTVEYAARLWSSVEHPPLEGLSGWRARLHSACSPAMLLDLVSFLPFYLGLLFSIDLRFVLLLRLLRFFKLARYSPGFASLTDAVWTERRALVASTLMFLGVLVMSASVMRFAEQAAQPDKFATIPDAMWWAVITLTTVGYGDVYPITPFGKVVAGVTAMLGVAMLAMPVGIIATSFAREIQRRDFVVTWSLVARVPLFAGLDAGSIARIMRVLKSTSYAPGAIICRKGEPAHSMYFVAEGEVEVHLPDRHVRLTAGQFFGEIAVMQRAERSASIFACGRVKLLSLDALDLRNLMFDHPAIAAAIEAVAKNRLGSEMVDPGGDLVREELDQPPPT